MANANLTAAKNAKNDEFYTQYADIEKEINAYLEFNPDTFRGKVVYSNCDDPYESNFFRYFVLNFKRLGLKQYIATSYKPSPIANTQLQLFADNGAEDVQSKGRPKATANKFIINDVGDMDGDGQFNLTDIAAQLQANANNEWAPLEGDGDFRSQECIDLLQPADIVVTNPPFSLFREYLGQLVSYDKQLVIIGPKNAVTYKEIFPLIMNNRLWSGATSWAGGLWFETMDSEDVDKYVEGVALKNVSSIWFTNLDHGRRHQPLNLMSMADNLKFNKKLRDMASYEVYDNYDAIEVPYTSAIPADFEGLMGVPISFLDKYSPEQFEIVGMCENEDLYGLKTKQYTTEERKQAYVAKFGKPGTYDLNVRGVVNRNGILEAVFQRILIRHRRSS